MMAGAVGVGCGGIGAAIGHSFSEWSMFGAYKYIYEMKPRNCPNFQGGREMGARHDI